MSTKSSLAAMLAAVVGFSFAGALAGQEEAPPAPPGCHWQPIAAVKVHLAVPDGWQYRETGEGDEISYEVTPAGPEFKKQSAARFRLTVKKITKKEVTSRAQGFVHAVVAGASEPPQIQENTVSTVRTFATVAHYAPIVAGGQGFYVAASAAANTSTGTMYTIRFDIPEAEWQAVWEKGQFLFAGMRLDDEF